MSVYKCGKFSIYLATKYSLHNTFDDVVRRVYKHIHNIRSINIDNFVADGMTNSIFQIHICNNVLNLMGFNKYDHQIFTDFSIIAHFSMFIYLLPTFFVNYQ